MKEDKIKIIDVVNFLGASSDLYKEEEASTFAIGYIYGLLASNNGQPPKDERISYMHSAVLNYIKKNE